MENINVEKMMQAQFNVAKLWYTLAAVAGIAILLLDVVVVFTNNLDSIIAIVVAILAILNAIFVWRSDRLRDTAEMMLRMIDMNKSLGWEFSPREIANLLATVPKRVKKAARSNEPYQHFASNRESGTQKLLENLEESAWWSKLQAKKMAFFTGAFGIAMLILAFVTLWIALQVPMQASASGIANMTITVITFAFSGGYIRLAFDYNSFAHQAHESEELASHLQKQSGVSETEAIHVMHEYQINRATSPLLPTWLWKMMHNELNELWNERIKNS